MLFDNIRKTVFKEYTHTHTCRKRMPSANTMFFYAVFISKSIFGDSRGDSFVCDEFLTLGRMEGTQINYAGLAAHFVYLYNSITPQNGMSK